ncbi:MAG: CYTH and CHAD domain-containing protein [Acidimicrobiales bacterium]
MRELEWKAVVEEGFELRPDRLVVPGGTLSARRTSPIHDEYIDTDDLRLARWGVTVRWRDGEGWTVKLPRQRPLSGSVLDRSELHIEGDPESVPDEVAALVAPFARHQVLHDVAQLETMRTTWTWTSTDGVVVGELVDDHVAGRGRNGDRRFREIEFELGPGGDPDTMAVIVESLGLADPRPAVPKLVRLLGDEASAPPDVVRIELPKQPTAADVIHAAIAASVQRLITQIPAARLGVDPEGVHQARVATRRLRSDLRTFAPLLDKEWARELRRELSWLADELGAVRDSDVLQLHLAAALAANPEIDQARGADILGRLAAENVRKRDVLVGHLADERAITLYDHCVQVANDPRLRKRARKRVASQVLPPLMKSSWRALRSEVRGLSDPPAEVELHELRILAKRVRYAAEAVAPAVGKKARKFASSAAAIQDVLGELHDSVVAAEWLELAAATDLDAAGAFAAGRLAQHCDPMPSRAQRNGGTAMTRCGAEPTG